MAGSVNDLIKKNDTLFYWSTKLRQQYYRYCFTDEGMIRHIFMK